MARCEYLGVRSVAKMAVYSSTRTLVRPSLIVIFMFVCALVVSGPGVALMPSPPG
jgi:hypothetical protein